MLSLKRDAILGDRNEGVRVLDGRVGMGGRDKL